MILFELSTPVLVLVVFGVTFGATAIGWFIGRALRERSDHYRDSFAVIQGALLGFMALVLAFALSLGVGRYQARRDAVVTEANAIGTTYLRAQTLAEPARTESLDLLRTFTDDSIVIAKTRPGGGAQNKVLADSAALERRLWNLAGNALDTAPTASAPRLYVESLNEMFDAQTARVVGLGNRVPTPVLLLELTAAGIALAALAMHLALLGRGILAGALAALLIGITLFVTADLDRPSRGFIRVPATSLQNLRTSMNLPPSAGG